MADNDTKPDESGATEVDKLKARLGELETHETALRQRIEALQDNRQSYTELADSLPQTVFEMDLTGRLTYINQHAYRQFGYEEDASFDYLNALDMMVPEDRERAQANIERLLRGEPVSRNRYTAMRRDGATFPAEIYSRCILHEDTPVGLRGIVVDVTERERAEAKKRDFETHLQRSQHLESLGELTGGIAHEFNNLLMVIQGNADLARQDTPPDNPVQDWLEEITKSGQRAADLCLQMLAYSGQGKYVVEDVELSEVIREMDNLLAISASKNAILTFVLGDGLPSARGDANQLQQVVVNLVSNASEAMEGEGGTITITTRLLECDRDQLDTFELGHSLEEGPYVSVEVTDTGPGMDADVRRRMFDPFFSTHFSGTGLGLAAVHGIMRSHGGGILVDTAPGAGTTIQIILPVETDASAATPGKATAPHEWRGQGTVLVVDDEPGVRKVAERMVSRLGFEVITATDGMDALECYREFGENIACILLDLSMPYMDGMTTLAEIQKINPDVRVILSSGFAEQKVEHEMRTPSRGS